MLKSTLVLPIAFLLIPFVSFSQNLYISAGTQLVINGTAHLVMNNTAFTNNGIFSASSGTVVFTGNAATVNSFIGGSSTTSFNHLSINKSANHVQLSANINVGGIINMVSDNLLLNNYNIDLGTTGSITGESATSSISGIGGGFITCTALLNAPVAVNVGNLGIEITSAANLGSTMVRRGHASQMAATGHPSVSRYFDIQPTNNTALNATIKFYYLDTELGALAENGLFTWASADGGINWLYRGKNASDATANFVTKTGLTNLSRITLNADQVTLPVRSLHLTARLVNGDALLSWTTIDEYNNDHFEIESSANGINFSSIGPVNSYGNSNGPQTYLHTDIHPYNGTAYYRIKQLDIDGHYSYSNTVTVNTSGALTAFFQVFPNPAESLVSVQFYSPAEKIAVLHLYDAAGKLIQAKKISCIRGMNETQLDLGKLPASTYLLTLESITTETLHLIKK
jgi:hypothetical protein